MAMGVFMPIPHGGRSGTVLTTGYDATYSMSGYFYGFDHLPTFGSLVPDTYPPQPSASIVAILVYRSGGSYTLEIDVVPSVANSGWTSIRLGSKTFNRTSFAYTKDAGMAIWTRSGLTSNQIPWSNTSSGEQYEVVFT